MAWALTPSPGPSPTSIVTATLRPTQTASAQPSISTPTASEANSTPTPIPGELRLIYLKSDGATLGVSHSDGTPTADIPLPQPALFPSDLQNGASPAGEWLALRTGQPGNKDLNLTLVHLPDGQARALTPLLSPALQAQVLKDPKAPAEFLTAVTLPGSLAWSPDGRFLAFIAAVDGPSSDLYLYDTSTQKIRRMTSGLNEAAAPIWSPDSLWVIFQDVTGFNINNGWKISKVWAAAVDHNEIRSLYNPPANSIGEIFLGWTSPSVMLIYTQAPDGIKDIREIPVSARWTGRLYAGPVDEAAFDPQTRTLMIVESDQTGKQLGLGAGLYRLFGPKPAPKYVQAGEWSGLRWYPQLKRFFASGMPGLLGIAPDGSSILIKNEVQMLPSPNGQWFVCWGDPAANQPGGLRLYQPDGALMQEISPQPVDQVLWSPDSKSIFFSSNSELYQAAYPQFQAKRISAAILPGSLSWSGR